MPGTVPEGRESLSLQDAQARIAARFGSTPTVWKAVHKVTQRQKGH